MTLLPETVHWTRNASDIRTLANTASHEISDDLANLLPRDRDAGIDLAAAQRAFETAAVCMTAALQRLAAHHARHTPNESSAA